jgi:hypothetical protein
MRFSCASPNLTVQSAFVNGRRCRGRMSARSSDSTTRKLHCGDALHEYRKDIGFHILRVLLDRAFSISIQAHPRSLLLAAGPGDR